MPALAAEAPAGAPAGASAELAAGAANKPSADDPVEQKVAADAEATGGGSLATAPAFAETAAIKEEPMPFQLLQQLNRARTEPGAYAWKLGADVEFEGKDQKVLAAWGSKVMMNEGEPALASLVKEMKEMEAIGMLQILEPLNGVAQQVLATPRSSACTHTYTHADTCTYTLT